MTLLDLMNVYRIKTNNDNIYSLLLNMFDAGKIDARVDREILAERMLMDCGRREPRYNTTDTFLFFGSVWLESKRENITKKLDLLTIRYDPLNEYEEHRNEDIARAHQSDDTETKNRDVETTDANSKATSTTDEHFVSAENESVTQLRTRDVGSESITTNNGETIDEDINTTKSNTTTHNDNITRTVSGHKTPQAELIRAELEKAKLNIYDSIIEDFADIMFINVF